MRLVVEVYALEIHPAFKETLFMTSRSQAGGVGYLRPEVGVISLSYVEGDFRKCAEFPLDHVGQARSDMAIEAGDAAFPMLRGLPGLIVRFLNVANLAKGGLAADPNEPDRAERNDAGAPYGDPKKPSRDADWKPRARRKLNPDQTKCASQKAWCGGVRCF